MGNHSDSFIMSHALYLAVIHDLENASFGLGDVAQHNPAIVFWVSWEATARPNGRVTIRTE